MPGVKAREGQPLSPTETDVLIFLSKGMRAPEIAELIGCTRNTVSSHLARIYAKIGVNSAAEAGAWAVEHGLIGGRSRDVQNEIDRLWKEFIRLNGAVEKLGGLPHSQQAEQANQLRAAADAVMAFQWSNSREAMGALTRLIEAAYES